MSFVSDVTPFPRRSRLGGSSTPKVRPIMNLEWSKLFAEAREKDTKAANDFAQEEETRSDDFGDSDTEGSDCCTKTEKSGNNGTETMVENEGDMPLNLCYKSNTMPSFNIGDSDILDLSSENKKPLVPARSCLSSKKQNSSCTLPNFQTYGQISSQSNLCPQRRHLGNVFVSTPQKSHDSYNTASENLVSQNNNNNIINNNNLQSNEKLTNGLDNRLNLEVANLNHQRSVPSNVDNESNKIYHEVNRRQINEEAEKKSNIYKNESVDCNVEKPYVVQQRPVSCSNPANEDRFAVPAVPVTSARAREQSRILMVNGKSYQVLAPIGKGGSSKVYLVLNKENELLAVKCVKLSGVEENVKNDYLNEIQHLMKMQHSKHVIRLYDHQYLTSQKLLYAVMERGDTDLSRFLRDKAASDEGISPELIMYYWTEMLHAVKSIHDNNIIHRDLKPANFLLVSGRLKLIDFGIASSIQNGQTSVLMETQSGTFNYMSPEALSDLGSGEETILKIGRKTDVWSLGCILYYFLYKKTPFQDFVKPHLKMRAITDPKHVVKFPKLPGIPEILIESCKRCLIHDKNQRASIEELLAFRNQPLLTLPQVLRKLKTALSPEEYQKAVGALKEDEL